MLVVNYGGGTNSTAMLVGALERGIRPDVIVMADTSAEQPHTYRHLAVMQAWCARVGFPEIGIARNPRETLEAECLRIGTLPSKAYGFAGCTDKHKIRPMKAHLVAHPAVIDWRAANPGALAERWIGYDAGEDRRASGKSLDDGIFRFHYPLIQWGWDRDGCVDAIARHGLPQPGKSSCFFCPNSKRGEVRRLRLQSPDLFDRALAMEAKALASPTRPPESGIVGLGRGFAWADTVAQTEFDLGDESSSEACGYCYDGE